MTDYYQSPQGRNPYDPYAQQPASRYAQPAPQAAARAAADPYGGYAQPVADAAAQPQTAQAPAWEQQQAAAEGVAGDAYAGAYAAQPQQAPEQAAYPAQPAPAPIQDAYAPQWLTTPQKVAFFFMGLLGSFVSVLWVSMMNLGKPYRSDATKLALIGAAVGILLYILLIVGSCSAMAAAVAPYAAGSSSYYSY